jgi:hypothetical protein
MDNSAGRAEVVKGEMMENGFSIQRRKTIRANYPGEDIKIALTRDEDCNYKGKYTGEDLSATGIGLRTSDERLREGAEININFRVLDQKEINANGKVVWRKLTDNDNINEKYRLGVKFYNLDLMNREAISKSIFSDGISEEQKIEYRHLREEIHNCINNLLKITLTVNTLTFAFIGASLAIGNPFLFLLPLLMIELGFRLFKLQLLKIRRIATYIRAFFEPQLRNLKWEEHLYKLREILDLKKKAYSIKEYYNTAKFLGLVCFSIGIYRGDVLFRSFFEGDISYPKLLLSLLIYSIAGFLWFSYSLPRIKEESIGLKGAGGSEKEFYYYWEQLKRHKENLCFDFSHMCEILRKLSGREKLESIQDLEGLRAKEEKCFDWKNCPLNSIVRNLIDNFKNPCNEVRLKRNNALYIFVAAAEIFLLLFFAALPIILVHYAFLYTLKHEISIWYKNPLVYLCIILLLGMAMKVRIKNIYYRIFGKNSGGEGILVKSDCLREFDDVNPSEDETLQFPPSNYMEYKTVPLLSWIFYYGTKEVWARDNVYFLREKWGKSSKDFVQYLWTEKTKNR